MNTDLHPGDICVIHGVRHWDVFGPECAGRHVVLVSSYELVGHPQYDDGIYWRCSGLSPRITAVHTSLLRKIPPAPLDTDVTTDQEITI